jgi:phage/plasmid-associated DNA primase
VAAQFEKASMARHKYHYIDGWSIYSKDKYQKVDDEREIESYIRNFIVKKCKIHTTRETEDAEGKVKRSEYDASPSAKMKSRGYIVNVLTWLRDMPGVKLKPSQKAPCVLGKCRLNPAKTIAVQNGLLDISNPSKPVLHDFTDEFYTFNYLPVDYDPEATAPTWLWALGEYFQDDKKEPDTLVPPILHRWIFDFLTSDTSHHKIQAVIGRKRSGKSTIGRVIVKLLGRENISNMSIQSLSSAHGLQPLVNKQLGIMWDASITGRNSDNNKAVETLKSISGEDGIQVNPKGKAMIDLEKLPMGIMMFANEVQDLRDPSGALAGRFTFLKTTKSFYGNEDPSIEVKIGTELAGILNLVLNCPKGKRAEHPNSAIMQQEFLELSSPHTAFINEWCKIDGDSFVPSDVLWLYYCLWCDGNQHHRPSKQKFKIAFNGVHDEVERYRPRLNEEKIRGLRREYNLDQNLDPKNRIKIVLEERPQCYSGIDIKESVKLAKMEPSGPDQEPDWTGYND